MMDTVIPIFAIPLLAACLIGWFWIAWRRLGGHPPLAWQPGRPVPWTIVDVCFFLAVYLLLQMTGGGLVRAACGIAADAQLEQLPAGVRAVAMAVSSAATMLAAAISLLTLFAWHAQATWRDIGWDSRRVAEDLRIGVAAFVLLAPPVYAVQVLLVQWYPYEHPLITLLKERPDPVFLTVSGFTALLVAPLAEEYFFRVLLQGWLEKLHSAGSFSSTQTPIDRDRRPALWPIFATAALFGLLHAAHGPAPAPLFLLALGLGYLYRQTHRILPSVVAHLLFNACSLAALLLALGE